MSTIAVVTLCVLSFNLEVAAQESGASDSDTDKLTAVILTEFPPRYLIDEDGHSVGFAVEVMNGIAAEAQLDIDYLVVENWTEVYAAIRDGRADLIPNMGITPSRQTLYDFSIPVEVSPISIFVRASTSDIDGASDLSGKRVAAVKHNVAIDLLGFRQDVDMSVHEDAGSALFALLSGEVDALVYPEHAMQELAQAADVEKSIKVVGEPMAEIKRGIALLKGRAALLGKLNLAIERYRQTSDYQDVYLKWHATPEGYWTVWRVTLLMSGVALVILIVMAIWRYLSLTKMHRMLIASVDARKTVENELQKLVQAMEQSPESIAILNLDNDIEYVNAAFTRATGCRKAEVVGKNLRSLKWCRILPEDYDAVRQRLTHGKNWKGIFTNKRRSGTEYVEQVTISPIMKPDAEVTHYLVIKEDITERQALENELQVYRDSLEEQVEIRTRQLSEARVKADIANQTKSAFLANMSHEIRTPMNAILGLTHLMLRANPSVRQAERLSKIDTSAKHLLSLINDVLDISKIEAGKLQLENTDFDLQSVFDDVYSTIRDEADRKGITIEIDTVDAVARVRGDQTRLCQALLNYAGNAIKFTETGTITLRARMLEESAAALLMRFEVQDTGIGIAPDQLAVVFDAFEQEDTSTTRRFGGTGLGLSITRHLAELMGGGAGVSSELDKGSIFWFSARLQRGNERLPEADTSVPVDGEALLRSQCAGARILLVEDNAINLEVVTELLNSTGLVVETAKTGLEAVQKVSSFAYDLLLMDVQMPVMDGLEATRVIRTLYDKPELPVIALTANAFKEDRRLTQVAGMNDFISKPVNPDDLFSTLAKWLPKSDVSIEAQSSCVDRQPVTEMHASDEAEREESPVDTSLLANLFGNNLTMQHNFLRKFLLHTEEMIEDIHAASRSGDLQALSFHAHKLKSSCLALGAAGMAELCLKMEEAGRNGDMTVIDRYNLELDAEMHRVKSYVDAILSEG